MFLGKGVLKTCSKFTGEHPCRSVISIEQLYWSHTSAWVLCWNLLYIFRTTFSKNTSGWLLGKSMNSWRNKSNKGEKNCWMLRILLCYYKYWGRNLNEYPNISRENSFLFRGNSTIQSNLKKTNKQSKICIWWKLRKIWWLLQVAFLI